MYVQVYQVVGPKLIRNVLEGFNATMIAYGQTGSGKTFTMEGSKKVREPEPLYHQPVV
ncbi:unnamed protein product, partial [Sphacelaria rigidula]